MPAPSNPASSRPRRRVELCANAIAEREGEVGAFVTLDLEGVRKAALAPGLKDKPLRGLPVALKDIFDTADMPTEYGSPIYAGHRPTVDASLVAMIRRAGGTLIGKTVTTEFAHTDPGKTRNPQKPRAHAGRLVVGLGGRRRRGLLSDRDRHADRRFGDPAGELLRRRRLQAVVSAAADRRHQMRVLASRHRGPVRRYGRRTWPSPLPPSASAICASTAAVPASPRIGVLREQPWPPASDDMIAALDSTARAASAANARVRDIKLTPVLAAAFRAHSTIHAYEAARSLASEYERARDKLAQGRARTGRERLCHQRRRL